MYVRGSKSIVTAAWLASCLGGCAGTNIGECASTSDCASSAQICIDGQCADCSNDAQCAPYGEGAVCRSGACTSCATLDGGCGCEPGELGCACPCGDGLACVGEVCVECVAGARSCACRTSGDACDPGLACQDRSCVDCTLGAEDCDCDEGSCQAGLVCGADLRCHSPASCEELRQAGLCPVSQACALVAGTAMCLDECAPGFRADGGACVPCSLAESVCTDGVEDDCDGSIDCADPDCDTSTCGPNGLVCSGGACACPGGSVEAICGDGADDDCDGSVDCADADCDASMCGPNGRACSGGVCACPGGPVEAICGDGGDDDCDGRFDCDDADCGGSACGLHGRVCIDRSCACPASAESCNGRDDDCDGSTDEGCPAGLVTSGTVHNLPQHGGGGGSLFDRTCPVGSAIVGVDVRSGVFVDNLRPRCAALRLRVDTTTSPDFTYRVVWDSSTLLAGTGGGGGVPSTLDCPDDQIVIGVLGRSGTQVDRVQFRCGTVTIEREGSGWRTVVRAAGLTPTAGGTGGGAFDDTCPSGMVLRGLVGRSAAWIDRVGGVCATVGVSTL